jgi:hypothetical protein
MQQQDRRAVHRAGIDVTDVQKAGVDLSQSTKELVIAVPRISAAT